MRGFIEVTRDNDARSKRFVNINSIVSFGNGFIMVKGSKKPIEVIHPAEEIAGRIIIAQNVK